MKTKSINSLVYTVADIMTILNISKNVAYDLVRRDDFPKIMVRSTYRIPKKAFEEWLNIESRKMGGYK